jgi:hypothetical protein
MAYYDQHAGNISRLIAMKGNIAAQTALERGRIWSDAMNNIGQIASRTIGQWAQYKQDEPARQFRERQLAEQTRGLDAEQSFRELLKLKTDPATGITNYPGVVSELRTAGYADKADAVDQQFRARENDELTRRLSLVTGHKTAIGQIEELIAQAQERPDLWPKLRPVAVGLVSGIDPEMAAKVPETFDAPTFSELMTKARVEQTRIDSRAKGLKDLIESAGFAGQPLRELVQSKTGSAHLLSTAESPEAWAAVMNKLTAIRVDPEILKGFGGYDDGDGPRRAADSLVSPEQRMRAEPNTEAELYAAALNRYAVSEGYKNAKALPWEAELEFRTLYSKTDRAQTPERLDPTYQVDRADYNNYRQDWDATHPKGQKRSVPDPRFPNSPHLRIEEDVPYTPPQSFDQWRKAQGRGPYQRPAPVSGQTRGEQYRAAEAEFVKKNGRKPDGPERGQLFAGLGARPPRGARPAAPSAPASTPAPTYGTRHNSTDPKGDGYFGALERPDGSGVMSEFSIGVTINGKETEIPTLVPSLTKDEVAHILAMDDGDPMPASIVRKARAHAEARIKAGKNPFAQPGEQRPTLYPDLPRKGAPKGDIYLRPDPNLVRMLAPDGKRELRVPQDQVEEALTRGATIIE